MQTNAGFGHLDSLVDEIQKKQSDHVKLESQLRQQRQRAESDAADASRLKSELDAAAVEKLSLQKRIGLLSRKNEDLAEENAKLLEEKCDFQRSMANNEAKLRENETDLRAAQKNFVDELDKANAAYSRNRAAMNTLSGRTGDGCADIPSPEELDALKAAAAKAQEANLRAAENEARMHAVEAEALALKAEAAENARKLLSLRREVVAVKAELKRSGGGKNSGKANAKGAQGMGTQHLQLMHQRNSELEQEVVRVQGEYNSHAAYIAQLEKYITYIDDANVYLRQQLGEHDISDSTSTDADNEGRGGASRDARQDNTEDTGERRDGGQDLTQPAGKQSDAFDQMMMPPPSPTGRGQE